MEADEHGGMPVNERSGAHRCPVGHRFPAQTAEFLPGDYQLTGDDRQGIMDGAMIAITGDMLARLKAASIEVDGELFVYLAAARDNSLVISDWIIPHQTVGYTFCEVAPKAVLRVNREARLRDLEIVAAAHSHGHMGSFTSGVDRDQHGRLAIEGVGRFVDAVEIFPGEIKLSPAMNRGEVKTAEIRFAGVEQVVGFKVAGSVRPEDLREAELHRADRTLVTCFATTNERGEHLFPTLRLKRCSQCGHANAAMRPPEKTVVKVIGPTDPPSEEQLEQLRRVIKDRVKRWSSSSWGKGYHYHGDDDYEGYWSHATAGSWRSDWASRDDDERQAGESAGCAPYEVRRHGRVIARIPPAVMEQAAAATTGLARALGWTEEERPREEEKTDGTRDAVE